MGATFELMRFKAHTSQLWLDLTTSKQLSISNWKFTFLTQIVLSYLFHFFLKRKFVFHPNNVRNSCSLDIWLWPHANTAVSFCTFIQKLTYIQLLFYIFLLLFLFSGAYTSIHLKKACFPTTLTIRKHFWIRIVLTTTA